jgi:hypothetical protein
MPEIVIRRSEEDEGRSVGGVVIQPERERHRMGRARAPCEMGAIVEAIDLVVGAPPSAPFSLTVATSEIVGLLFPVAKPRTPVLRVLAGLDTTVAGEVRFPCHGRVVVAATGQPLSDALSKQPDLVLLDAASDVGDHNMWARLASERALGTSFVIATSSLAQAYRSDRVSLVSWGMNELTRTSTELVRQIASQTHEFLAVLAEGQPRRSGALAADLRRLIVGSRALLSEMRRRARAGEEMVAWHTAAWRLARVSLNDRLLDAAIAEAQDQ